ncbi:tripartite motif-containing protein 55-like [Mugil cephalus]|uniref:tripartite motif-containing protein 55-like n=1 Tax=Mugil cephalus TaxID=48193 RepID=UPI001FB57E6B|nr:tripartite motif-containing protein 55-like [Mugil cephalus]
MDSLEKQLVCPICLEMFTKPVVILPCQHNLCRKCANDVFQASNPYLSSRTGSTVASGGVVSSACCPSKPVPEEKGDQPMCEDHEDEKINIYCLSCSVPTCSLCKVFGAHRDCEVAPLQDVFTSQKAELSDSVSMLVGNNERIQAVISQLEETCRAVDESGRRQKSQVCASFDHLYALMEERKAELTLRINAEQEEKLHYIRGLRRRSTEHLEACTRLLETAFQTMDQAEMAQFLQESKPLLQKMLEGTNTSHLDQVQPGYEKMEHFTASFEKQRRALASIDFIQLGEDDEDDEEDEGEVEVRSRAQQVTPAHSAPPPQRPPETPPTPARLHRPKHPAPFTCPPLASPQSATPTRGTSPQSEQGEAEDGPKHVFSFSWLNQK